MKSNEFKELYNILLKEEMNLLNNKGIEYSDENNTFKNFEEMAIKLEIHPIHVLMVYYSKHNDSIFNYTKKFIVFSDEDITSRIMDARNYLALLYAMIYKYRNLEKNHKWYIQ